MILVSILASYDADADGDANGRLNNWEFSSMSSNDEHEFGGIDGVLSTTLAVNHVTTTETSESDGGDEAWYNLLGDMVGSDGFKD